MFIAGHIAGVFSTIFAILSLQCKSMKSLLKLLIISSGLLIINFAFLDVWSLPDLILAVQTVITFIFKVKNIKIPSAVIVLFMASLVTSTIYMYEGFLDILPGIAAMIYTFSIIQKKSSDCRILATLHTILYIIFDIGSGAWAMTVPHILLLCSAVIGIKKLDTKKTKSNLG